MKVQVPGPRPWIEWPWPRGKYQTWPEPKLAISPWFSGSMVVTRASILPRLRAKLAQSAGLERYIDAGELVRDGKPADVRLLGRAPSRVLVGMLPSG